MADLRVAIVYDCLFPVNTGGGERVYRRIAEMMSARGATVDYVTRGQWQRGAEPSTVFGVVEIWRGAIYDENGMRTTGSAIRFGLAAFGYFALRRRRYDLVISSALPVLTLLAVRCALLFSHVVVVADWLEVWTFAKWRSYAGRVSGAFGYGLQTLGVYSTRLHTVNSRFTARRISALRPAVVPVTLGLIDIAKKSTELRPADTPPYVIFVGRLIWDKRVSILPAALAEARKRLPELRMVIVGEGPEKAAVRAEIERSGAPEAFDILGRVSDEHLAGLVAGAAALVNPSVREGFGLVVTEAAALGVPSILVEGEDNAAAELIVDGENGFLAADASAPALAAAMLGVVEAGAVLRASTSRWFDRAHAEGSLSGSIDAIIASMPPRGVPARKRRAHGLRPR